MERLLPEIQRWFDAKPDHFQVFALADCRLEGWFKGEMLVLLGELKRRGRIQGVEREANILHRGSGGRKQVDFRMKIEDEVHLCELKALCISQAAGTPRNLAFYFRDNDVGLIKDFRKLDQLEPRNKWVLGFIYPRPSEATWDLALRSLPPDISHWTSVNPLSQASEVLFVSLWNSRAEHRFGDNSRIAHEG